jgi:hypothetical protein
MDHKIGIQSFFNNTIFIHAKVKKDRELDTGRNIIMDRVFPKSADTPILQVDSPSNQIGVFYFEQRFPARRIIKFTGNISNTFIPQILSFNDILPKALLGFKFPPSLIKETNILFLQIKDAKTTFLFGSTHFRPFNHIVTFLQLLPMPKEPAPMLVHLLQESFTQEEKGHKVRGKAREAGIDQS